MTVYEYIKMMECSYDVYDDEFDNCITCEDCEGNEDKDNYFRFYVGLQKLANVVKADKDYPIADWGAMIRHNKPILEEYMKENWIRQYKDEDDFVWEWINEFQAWGAGYVSESTYEDFVKNYMSRMTRVEREDK